MMRKALRSALVAAVCLAPGSAMAAEAVDIPGHDWSFSGIFGHFERPALQRGLQVYREVCAGCHGLRLIAFRNLADLGYSADEIKAIAAVPTQATGAWIEIDADGRGKSKLPVERIQAISLVAVDGMGDRPVLVLDFVLNWRADSRDALKLIRVRSDRFDPLAFAPGAESLPACTWNH